MAYQNIRFSTRRVGEVSGEPPENVRAAHQNTGHWRKIVPTKLPNRRLSWPALAVLEACGKIPKSLRPTPADELRDNLCAKAGTDLFQTHKVAAELLNESATGDTARAQIESINSDLRDYYRQGDALARRVGAVMQNEEDVTPDDWRRFNYFADQIENAAKAVCTPLRWHHYKPIKPASTAHGTTSFEGHDRD